MTNTFQKYFGAEEEKNFHDGKGTPFCAKIEEKV